MSLIAELRTARCRFCKKEFTSKHRPMCYDCYSKMVEDFKKFNDDIKEIKLGFDITKITTVLERDY